MNYREKEEEHEKRIASPLAILPLLFLLSAQGEEAAAAEKPEDDRYSMAFTLGGEERTIELTLLNESSAMLTSVDDSACRYEREGNAVRLFIQKEAENGTAAIRDQVPHDYLFELDSQSVKGSRVHCCIVSNSRT